MQSRPVQSATQVTLNGELSGFSSSNQWFPASVRLDNETIAVTGIDSTGKILTLATAAAQSHAANKPSLRADQYLYQRSEQCVNQRHGYVELGASSIEPPRLTDERQLLRCCELEADGAHSTVDPYIQRPRFRFAPPELHWKHVGRDAAASNRRITNQVAFSFGSGVTALSLLSTLFGSWGGSGASSTQSFTLLNGDDGVEPPAIDFRNALACLTGLEDIAIVAAPGSSALEPANAQAIIDELITHVSQQRAYRIAILDTPLGFGDTDYENVRAQIDSSYAALYVPVDSDRESARKERHVHSHASVRAALRIHGRHLRARRRSNQHRQGAR